MLNSEIVRKISDFVYSKPRSVQEIAEHIGKNWRTADRYVDEIEKEFGTISTRVFRGGTRGALKIVYWASVEKVSHSVFQEKLEQDINAARIKEDFSAFDIYQHVDEKKKSVTFETKEGDDIKELERKILMVEKQLLMFSGNLSFINLGNDKIRVFDLLEKLVRKGVSIKILCRVDMTGMENVERILSLNKKYGKELVEVRHDENPLRANIYDKSLVTLKEVKEPTGKIHELNKKVFVYYAIKDKEWIEWLSRIFWRKFNNSIDAHKRLSELSKLKIN